MARTHRDFSGVQPDLFRDLEVPALDRREAPELFVAPELRGAMNQALREAKRGGLSRERVIERMNLCLGDGHQVTLRQLNAWMAASKEDHPMPAEVLPAFCWATTSIAPFAALLHPLDYEPADRREQHALRLGEVAVARSRLAREERALRKQLGG